MEKDLKLYLERQFGEIRKKLGEHDGQFKQIKKKLAEHDRRFRLIDEQFIKIDEKFENLIEAVNAGTETSSSLQREVERIKTHIREKLGIEV